ncbi:MAG TPA: hypothetical protein VIG47_03455 [Gemmatimonadaceae bacterium]
MSLDKGQNRRAAERQIVDQSGVWWRVREVRVWDATGHEARSLIAAHEGGFRRLWDFPVNWAELADMQLVELVSKPVRRTSVASAEQRLG